MLRVVLISFAVGFLDLFALYLAKIALRLQYRASRCLTARIQEKNAVGKKLLIIYDYEELCLIEFPDTDKSNNRYCEIIYDHFTSENHRFSTNGMQIC